MFFSRRFESNAGSSRYQVLPACLLATVLLMGIYSPGHGQDETASIGLFQNSFDTSSPAIAPPWSMSPWMWEDDINLKSAIDDLVEGCQQHDLPLGAILLDSPWSTRYNSFRFDEKRYPEPQQMIDGLHKKNIRLVLWMTNIVNTKESLADAPGDDEDLFSTGKANGYFVNEGTPIRWWKGNGGLIDYTNPAAVEWWHRLMDRTLAMGIDGWKMDGSAEAFLLTKRQTRRGTLTARDYMDLYYRDTLHYSRTWKPDFATMVRSVDIANTRNDQPHAPFDAAPLTWVGDQRHSWSDKGLDEALRSSFRALDLNYPSVSSDTGGYQSNPKLKGEMPRLLYLRWAQWNALTPFFLIGGHNEHRPWKFDPEFLAIFRKYMWLHQELIPYFYSLHVQTSLREGQLMHRSPGNFQYQIGESLLAAVMTNEESRREIQFPEGEWIDYWNNRQQYKGGQTSTIDVPEDRSPLFVKKGSIIPIDVVNDAVRHGTAASAGGLTFDIYPNDSSTKFTLWNHKNFPPDLRRDRSLVTMESQNEGLSIGIPSNSSDKVTLRILYENAPSKIQINDTAIVKKVTKADWESHDSGWWYDAENQRLWIRDTNPGIRRVLVFK